MHSREEAQSSGVGAAAPSVPTRARARMLLRRSPHARAAARARMLLRRSPRALRWVGYRGTVLVREYTSHLQFVCGTEIPIYAQNLRHNTESM